MVWTCLPFIRSGQNHLARHSERGKEDKADRGRGWKTTSGNGQAWSSAKGKMEKTGCEIICGAPTTLTVKELMMMMMTALLSFVASSGCHFNNYPMLPRIMICRTLCRCMPIFTSIQPPKSTSKQQKSYCINLVNYALDDTSFGLLNLQI